MPTWLEWIRKTWDVNPSKHSDLKGVPVDMQQFSTVIDLFADAIDWYGKWIVGTAVIGVMIFSIVIWNLIKIRDENKLLLERLDRLEKNIRQ